MKNKKQSDEDRRNEIKDKIKSDLINLGKPELLDLLKSVITLRSSEDNVLHILFGLFMSANGILFLPLFANGTLTKEHLAVCLPLIGIGVSLMWLFLQRRTLNHIYTHEAVMESIQLALFNTGSKKYLPIFGEETMKLYLSRGPRVRQIMPAAPIMFFVLWTFYLIAFISTVWYYTKLY